MRFLARFPAGPVLRPTRPTAASRARPHWLCLGAAGLTFPSHRTSVFALCRWTGSAPNFPMRKPMYRTTSNWEQASCFDSHHRTEHTAAAAEAAPLPNQQPVDCEGTLTACGTNKLLLFAKHPLRLALALALFAAAPYGIAQRSSAAAGARESAASPASVLKMRKVNVTTPVRDLRSGQQRSIEGLTMLVPADWSFRARQP